MSLLKYGLSIALIVATGCSQSPSSTPSTEDQTADSKSYVASEFLSKSLPELADAINAGDLTSEALVEAYIARMDMIDKNGPRLQSILTVNPDALATAKRLDVQRAAGEIVGPLHGLPIVLKDNIETKDSMPTTAGALVLKDNVTGRDSPLVAGLRNSGAIILGKTNLSQWANFRSNQSMSGWSALGGQVRNPHMLDRNPCGSSSGSGAAVAASLAAGAVGTETNGSIICPSNVNGIVGFKPTVGLVSQEYIIPISSTQDTAGPMTKTVKGAAMMLTAMATGDKKADYTAGLDADSLKGLRIGVLNYSKGSNPDIHDRFEAAASDMEKAGAILVSIDEFSLDTENFGGKSFDILKYEFKATLNDYLASTPEAVTARTLADIIAFNKANADVELALFGQDILQASDAMGPLTDEAYIKARADILSATREKGLDKLLSDYNVDVLISPSGPVAGRIDPVNGDVWPSWAGAGGLAARAGYPHLSVPMGTVHGVPVGVSFIGGADQDAQILSYGYAYEQTTYRRADPQYWPNAEARPEIRKAMIRE